MTQENLVSSLEAKNRALIQRLHQHEHAEVWYIATIAVEGLLLLGASLLIYGITCGA